MSALTDYAENKILDWLLRGQPVTPPATLYYALVVGSPGDTGTGGTEVSGGAYARAAIASSMANWAGTQGAGTTTASTGTSGQTSNNVAVNMPAAPTANWNTPTHFVLWDALTGGNPWIWGALTTPQAINNGQAAPTVPVGALTIQIDS